MYLGIDIGGTKTLIASLDHNGVIKESRRFITQQGYQLFLRDLADAVEKLSTKRFIACAVGVPGRLDRENGIGLGFGNLAWKNVPIRDDIAHLVKCPVLIENDAKLAGLSEALLLKDRYDRVLYVTLGTGIGTAVISNQKIDPDFKDMEGGKVLLQYDGKLQSWESLASGKAIVKRYGQRASDIEDESIWKKIAHDIALGVMDLIAIVQPEVIVFGGSIGDFFNRFQPYLAPELQSYSSSLTPIPDLFEAKRPNEAVVYGCYDLIRSQYA